MPHADAAPEPGFIDVTRPILTYERCASLAFDPERPEAVGGKVDALLTSDRA
jgi:hypothetical protein